MTEQLRHLRAIITQPEADFGLLLGKVLSPSQPLQSEEFLRGREEQLAGIKRALYQPGRHVLIHGFRGVGKSSLAQTAAYSLSKGSDPIVIACDRTSTFKSITKSIFEEAIERNPAVQKRITEHSIGFSRWGFNAGSKQSTHEGPVAEPENINDAVRMAEIICEGENRPVFVVDEFDQLKDKQEQENFTNFIKQLSDRHVGARFIFCGIGESVDAMMAAHGSADRYFHTVGLEQLST